MTDMSRNSTTLVNKFRSERGFTLIELLVVMIIIGILAAVAIPIFLNQQKTARDTSLRSDVKNAATVVTTALVNYQSFAKLRVAAGASAEIYYLDNNSQVRTMWAGAPMWNDKTMLPKIQASEGVYMEILNVHTVNAAGGQPRVHEETEFCLTAMDLRSSYNWKTGDGAAGFDRRLYYDSSLGGIKTMNELVKAYQAGEKMACSGNTKLYIDATGTP